MGLEEIMEQVCATCHWPYVEPDEGSLDNHHCRHCPIEESMKTTLHDARMEVKKMVEEFVTDTLRQSAKERT